MFDQLSDDILYIIANYVAVTEKEKYSMDRELIISADLLKFRGICRRFAFCGTDVYISLCRRGPPRYRVVHLPPRYLSLHELHDVLCNTVGAGPNNNFAQVVTHLKIDVFTVKKVEHMSQ